ncbi:SurA N-terminal domain-containing protein [Pseudomonas entomophila]|uniref:SurA N-terminal domain-containing protein n=1 Tax=Pseudomonas entomophila TaxID=312306 RepID=UPI002406F318|nr:SurA N-terminal domain-containing protein [Pseudomonas entomophila]MDF9618746.1 SurA N-terminal domain-containing protein [Pseudomonas entomophila]
MRILLLCLLLGVTPAIFADAPVARVNGVEIGALRLERYFTEYLQAQGRAVASIRNPNLYQRLREQALDELIDKELLWQEARRQGIVIDDEQVRARLAEVEAAFGSPAVFARRLEAAGFDRDSFADYTRHEMAAQEAFARLTVVDEPSAAEIAAFQHANRHRLQGTQNQSDNAFVLPEQGQRQARDALVAQLQAQARQATRQRLRESATVERAD